MDKKVKERFVKFLDDIEKEDEKSEYWKKLDKYEKTLYRSADVAEFFIREVRSKDGDIKLEKQFRSFWHYVLGSMCLKNDDPILYKTTKE